MRQLLLLATASVVFAQTTETKPPDVGSSGATNSQSSGTPAPNPCESGAKALDQAEILYDTMGVDFGPYLTRVVQIVKHNWPSIMPPSVYLPIFKPGKLKLEFQILKDGTLTGLVRDTSSGDVALDRAAWWSITASTPFPPLPKEFPGKLLGLCFHYFYNLEPTGISISISPCTDVRVPAGSVLKFAAAGAGITDSSVIWSVTGPGCSKSACGTISDIGLYTAPADIPNPSTVIAEATSRSRNE